MRRSFRALSAVLGAGLLAVACADKFTATNGAGAPTAGSAQSSGGVSASTAGARAVAEGGSAEGGAADATQPGEANAGQGAGGEAGALGASVAHCDVAPAGGGSCHGVLGIGAYTSCVIAKAGVVKCWGLNERQQLGDGVASHMACGDGSERDCSPTAVEVSGLARPEKLAGGEATQCALNDSGNLFCWGLDLRQTPDTNLPTAIRIGLSEGSTALSLRFAFGVLPGDGTAWLGGIDVEGTGVLGSGPSVAGARRYLAPVVGLDDAVAFDVGWYHACAVRKSGGVVCWGKGSHGELGDAKLMNSGAPVAVAGLPAATAVAVGDAASCALLADASVVCWGAGTIDGVANDFLAPTPVPGLFNALDVRGGFGHFCALRDTGKVACWGDNAKGQLGGKVTSPLAPVEVQGLTDAVAIGVGAMHSCALRRTGEVRCWGDNALGQLGDGTFVASAAPKIVGRL